MHCGDLRHLSDSHGHAVRKERREVGDIGKGEVPTGVPCGTNAGIVVEQPLIQIRRSAATLTDGNDRVLTSLFSLRISRRAT
jgi:hypothetical protein